MKRKHLNKPRNLLALAPIMRKGGAHDKPGKVGRRDNKQSLKMKIRRGDFEKAVTDCFFKVIKEVFIKRKKRNKARRVSAGIAQLVAATDF